MNPDLEALLDLQDKDMALLEVDTRLRDLLGEVDTLDTELTRARGELEDARRALAAGVKRREDIEAKVEGLRVLQDRRRQRLDQAKTPRELQALTSELELARAVLAKEEAEWFRASEQTNELEGRVAAAGQRIEELEAEQVPAREELADRIAAVEAERTAAQAARQASASAVAKPLLHRYSRLQTNRQTQVVVALRGNACGACFTAVPMSRRSHIRAGLLIDGCEACGVILYAESDSESS
ncbi:MAG: hypothetical protein OEW44_08775 [Gemmatimonadota bacterium]|jgi:predicted  nucleic acid-binding Zn-ribbon protein|nr:hypothetical protein [Gemmatimonadota bacterium]